MVQRIIIDTDGAADDAVAMVCALRDPSIEVLAITTVFGGTEVGQAAKNALTAITYAGGDKPPVYAGCCKPMMDDFNTTGHIHGKDGLSDVGTFRCEGTVEEKHAVNAILDIVRESRGDVQIMTLGPLTNIAAALRKEPETMKKVAKLTVMGGGRHWNNPHTATAEANIYQDVHAAHIVVNAGIPLTMVTIDACFGDAKLGPDLIAKLRAGGEAANFCVDCNSKIIGDNKAILGYEEFDLPDPVTIAVLARPEIVTESTPSHTIVETQGNLTKGMTIFRQPGNLFSSGFGDKQVDANSTVVFEVNAEAFHKYLLDTLCK